MFEFQLLKQALLQKLAAGTGAKVPISEIAKRQAGEHMAKAQAHHAKSLAHAGKLPDVKAKAQMLGGGQ